MSAKFGKDWKINRVVKGTPDVYHELGGTVLDARIDPRITVHEEIGSGEGRQLSSQKITGAKPILDWKMNVRRLEDYITAYAMITAEGAVPAHTLYVTDGAEYHDFSLAKVNSCRISINQTESIKAAISVALKDEATPTPATFLNRVEPAMYKNAVTTLTLNTVAVTKWQTIEFGVDNNVLQEILGTGITPAEVEEQEAKYSMRIRRAAVGTTGKLGDALAGTVQDFVIALIDGQTSPITKTFTFADMYLTAARKEDKGLGIVYEQIEGKGKSLVTT